MKKLAMIALALSMAFTPVSTFAAGDDDDDAPSFGLAGILERGNRETLPPLMLSAESPLAEGPMVLESGRYYRIDIIGDGSQELGLVGPGFFRAIWVNQISVEGLEIRPLGLDSIEFDEAGTMRITFVAIKPGQYFLKIPGTTGETRRVEITIE